MSRPPTPGGCGAQSVVAVHLLLLLLLPQLVAAHLSNLPVNLVRSELSLEWHNLNRVPVEQLCEAAASSERTTTPINEVNLAHNRIEFLHSEAFTCLATALKIINLRHNRIKQIADDAFEALDSVQVLQLDYNLLSAVPSKESLKPMSSLRHLNLANNRIEAIQAEAFGPESGQLISLDLKGNPLRHISSLALVSLSRLQTLILSQSALSGTVSRLSSLTELRFYYLDRANLQVSPPDLCQDSRKLTSLILKSNQLERIPQFAHCQSLLLLDLSYNQIRGSLTNETFIEQPNLIDLYLGHNKIEFVHERAFVGLSKLQVLELNDNHLQQIHLNAFLPLRSTIFDLNLSNNPQLSSLTSRGLDLLDSLKVFGNPQLRSLPHFQSASSLALTYAYHCCDYLEGNNERMVTALKQQSSSVQSSSLLVDLLRSLLDKLSVSKSSTREDSVEDLDFNSSTNNSLDDIAQQQQQQQQLNELVLWPESHHRQLAEVEMNVWRTEILSLSSANNNDDATATTLNKRNQVRNSSRMSAEWQWLPPEVAPHLSRQNRRARAERGDHDDNDDETTAELDGSASVRLIDEQRLARHLNQIRAMHLVAPLMSKWPQQLSGSGSQQALNPSRLRSLRNTVSQQKSVSSSSNNLLLRHCLPKPGPFLPCQDLFDTWWLRLGVWMVFLLAFTGNILVIVVLSSVRPSSSTSALTSIMWLAHSKRHIDVPRFLVINLAVADLLMAMYLGLLAFVDLSTLGEFKLFAIKWQFSTGCKLAGFLGVLSSELSVFILAVITLERNYAITNAVHLNRRLSLQKAMLVIIIGYLFAISMAIMPLNGISDYRKFSICLPLDIDSNWSSQLYVITLISINTFSFLLLLSCYLRMYCAIRGSQAWNTNDLRIARRMSILVITDFLCWMPIIVAAIASLFGYHLIGANGIKILTIFILPLNSVANPFLYAITTKKFKRDLDTLMHRMRSVAHLDYLCCKHQLDNKDSKLFSGYNHQYQQNLMMMNKKRHQLDNTNHHHHHHHQVMSNLDDNQSEQRRRRRQLQQQQQRQRYLTQAQPLNDDDNDHHHHQTDNAVACSLKRTLPGHKPITQVRSCLLAQPRIVLDAAVESTVLASIDIAHCGLIKKSLSTNSPANLIEPRYCTPIAATSSAAYNQSSSRHFVAISNCDASGDAAAPRSSSVNWCPPLRSHSSGLSADALDKRPTTTCQPPVLVENPSSDYQQCRQFTQQQQQQQHYLSVYETPPIDRSASACGYRVRESSNITPIHSEVRVTGSYDTVRMMESDKNNNTNNNSNRSHRHHQQSGLKLSRSINRLLFSPIAKAWSSIQISLSSSNTQVGGATNHRHQNSSSKQQQHQVQQSISTSGATSPSHQATGKRDLPANSNTIDDLLQLSSPSSTAHHLLRLNERRMSRSCDVISNNQQQQQQQSGSSIKSPTSSNDATTSHYDYDDDQRILLATINRIASGRQKGARVVDEQQQQQQQQQVRSQYARNRCTRCRSWSPALLSKLEDCIHQFRFRLPSFGANAGGSKNEHQHDSSNHPSDSGELEFEDNSNQQVLSFDNDGEIDDDGNDYVDGGDEIEEDTYDEFGIAQHRRNRDQSADTNDELDEEDADQDKFNETCLLEWTKRRKELAKRYRFGRQLTGKLQHQSSTTSDTLSTRTAATLVTNVSLSFDSNTGIPVATGGQRSAVDQCQEPNEQCEKSNYNQVRHH